MTARWAATTAYTAGTVILPTVDNGRAFVCTTAGTSGSAEPTWPARYPAVTDGTAAWAPYTVILPSTLRSLQGWDDTTGRYSDIVIGNALLDAIDQLEHSTSRYLIDRPGKSWQTTSYGRPSVAIPGLRSATSVTWMGSTQTAGTAGSGGGGYQLVPDLLQTGVYTSISFRPLRATDGGPWWLSLGGATTNWFDTNADSPFDPRNYGGGFVQTSTEQDTVIVGDWGWAPGSEPNAFVHAVEILGSWNQQRPVSLLADSVITPQGGVLSYSQMPPEIRQFVSDFRIGTQAVSLG